MLEMMTRTKPMFWAERLGSTMSVRTTHGRFSATMRPAESAVDTVRRMGFRVVGGFTVDRNVRSRSTALVREA